ncbi:MAG: hypothetical protein KGZ69_10875 [Methylomonas sp.]|nr:hypothetical protein [Methylomonas sp.]
MALMAKDNLRNSAIEFFDEELAARRGELFVGPDGVWNSKSVTVLHNGVDTVKQLYSGLVIKQQFENIQSAYDAMMEEVEIDGSLWRLGSGRRGGYRYALNSRERGLVILLGSFYCLPEYNGHHLKIETSPSFTLGRTVDEIQYDLDRIAKLFITQLLHTGCAVHFCADVQGWDCPHDLDYRLTARAKRVVRNSGIQTMEYNGSDIAMCYGKGQSFLFGTASSLQFAVYNKTKAVKDKGEEHLWPKIWGTKLNAAWESAYDPEKTVWRIEARAHHSVVEQFSRGIKQDLRSFKAVAEHLTGLWQYALNNFRLDADKNYIDPFWQYLRDDLIFYHDAKAIEYKRVYKSTDQNPTPSDRAVMVCFGMLCSLYAKNQFSLNKASNALVNSGIWANLCSIYTSRGLDDVDIMCDLESKLCRFPFYRKQSAVADIVYPF